MKAKDLMIPIQEYLNPEDNLKEAANLLRIARRGEEKIGVKALPVLDESRKLIGILSIGDILKAVRNMSITLGHPSSAFSVFFPHSQATISAC